MSNRFVVQKVLLQLVLDDTTPPPVNRITIASSDPSAPVEQGDDFTGTLNLPAASVSTTVTATEAETGAVLAACSVVYDDATGSLSITSSAAPVAMRRATSARPVAARR